MNRSVLKDHRLWCLAVAETLVWAGFYYFFPAMLLRWEGDFGWTRGETTLAATCALVTSALAAPRIGRLIDGDRGRLVLTGSAILGAILLIALTQVDSRPAFIAVWVGLGLAMGGCLYEPCFAFLTHQRGGNAGPAITVITLVAGFAGSLSFPLSNAIADIAGWRSAALAFAGLVLVVAVPLFWIGTAMRDGEGPLPHERGGQGASALKHVMRGPVFWLLAIAFSTIALNHGMIVNHLLPLLAERQVDGTIAVVAISLIGVLQVVGRVVMILAERRVGMVGICGVSFLVIAAAGVLLSAAYWGPVGGAVVLLFCFVTLQGAGYGVTSITRPVVTALLLGRRGFGSISGAMALPFVACTAISPSVGSAIWSWGGYGFLTVSLVILILFGFFCFTIAVYSAKRLSDPPA